MPRLVFCTRLLFAAFAPGAVARAQGPEIVVDRDDVDVATSCRVRIPAGVVVADANRDGVVRVVADDVVLTFVGETLRGAPRNAAPETFEGFAVRVVGRRGVRLQGLRAAGYRAALYASRADGLVLSDADVSDNRAQRLRSDARRCDDGADWLAPHDNDRNEWLERYGAGAYVEDSRGVAVENLRCRRTQNGVVFDRVDASRVADCDASFLSGWGLALWRSSDNLVSRNAFDFCVRGYSHGVYNRGQDSAGVLLFEQCSRNRFLENSITHGGDGVFGFAGKEALGDAPPPAAAFDYRRRGCNDNVFVGNDLSYAAAHGLELTFSFGARIEHNRFAGNAICGVWAGYSQDMVVARNAFSENGGAGYGLERGGVNVEHGAGNLYAANTFVEDRCGLHLWGRDGGGFAGKPWGRANPPARPETASGNAYVKAATGVHVRGARGVRLLGERFEACGDAVRLEDAAVERDDAAAAVAPPPPLAVEAVGAKRPVGARPRLRGREHIVMTPYGPWDHVGPLARLAEARPGAHVWRLHGLGAFRDETTRAAGDDAVRCDVGKADRDGAVPCVVRATRPGVHPYRTTVRGSGGSFELEGTLTAVTWRVAFFPWKADPRVDEAAWRAAASDGSATVVDLEALDLRFGGGGPSQLPLPEAVRGAALPRDRFGLTATARLPIPAGRWRLSVRSDDGVRVKVDGATVIDAWTWHAPQTDAAILDVAEPRVAEVDVAYFEIDGHAELSFEIEPAGAG